MHKTCLFARATYVGRIFNAYFMDSHDCVSRLESYKMHQTCIRTVASIIYLLFCSPKRVAKICVCVCAGDTVSHFLYCIIAMANAKENYLVPKFPSFGMGHRFKSYYLITYFPIRTQMLSSIAWRCMCILD